MGKKDQKRDQSWICHHVLLEQLSVFHCKSHSLKNSAIQAIGQNTFTQFNIKVFWSSISMEEIHEYHYYFCWDIH